MRTLVIAFVLLMLAAFSSQTALSESTDAAVREVFESAQVSVPARQTKRNAPEYPRSELRKEREAWVHVTYCVDESGAVQNVSVLDSVGNRSFDHAAIKTVQGWKFEPALRDGEPTWQSRNDVLITFALHDSDKGAGGRFVRQYRKIGRLIDEKKLQEADELFWNVYRNSDLSLYELGKLWAQRVRYEGKIGDMSKLHSALHRATASNGEWIDPESYLALLQLRVKVEISLGKYHAAERAFDKLVEASDENSENVLALMPTMEKLQTMIEGNEILKIKAEVRAKGDCMYCDDSWYFTPVRNDFTIRNIAGALDSIDMRCDHKRFESPVSDNVDWHIPESWGTCRVQFYGDPGTTFDLLMLPPLPPEGDT